MASSDVAQEGWYSDPEHPHQQRYWDGSEWTDHYRLAYVKAEGLSCSVSFDGHQVVVTRRGTQLGGAGTQLNSIIGALIGDPDTGEEKVIPLSIIASLRFRRAGKFSHGYIAFGVPGTVEREVNTSVTDAGAHKPGDLNTVMFHWGCNDEFEVLRAALQSAIGAHNNRVYHQPSGADEPSGDASGTAADIAERIKQLHQLKEDGILSDDEFQAKKTDLLGRM